MHSFYDTMRGKVGKWCKNKKKNTSVLSACAFTLEILNITKDEGLADIRRIKGLQ